ncbi:DUF928 domain-containing protein [Floridanema evergladense]|uniref:DUF928 domain-containing protein n=1 Tax=Floridaenema evergladense BLCC-F167 TaxID=3153639 RepID=A0ABV4WMF4_9CYAN
MSKMFNRILNACILTLFLSVESAAYAGYRESSSQRPPRTNTDSSGSRGGCSGVAQLPLTTLAPQKHIGQTVSSHPTFAWFVPDSPEIKMEYLEQAVSPYPTLAWFLPVSPEYKTEFSLYEYSSNGTKNLIKKIELKSSPGINKLSLPKDSPGLTVGKTYLWQVAVLCNENYPSADLVKKAEIEIVELPSNVKMSLDAVKDPLQRADIYAQAGLWYDALGEALTANGNSQSGKAVASLLENLAQIENAEKSSDLRQIASTSRS